MFHEEKVKTTQTHTYTPFYPSLTPTFATAKGGVYNPGYIKQYKISKLAFSIPKKILINCKIHVYPELKL